VPSVLEEALASAQDFVVGRDRPSTPPSRFASSPGGCDARRKAGASVCRPSRSCSLSLLAEAALPTTVGFAASSRRLVCPGWPSIPMPAASTCRVDTSPERDV
jgi:hypothetical protein